MWFSALFVLNKRCRTPKGQYRIDNPEKLATYGTQDEEKYNTICVESHHTVTNKKEITAHLQTQTT